MQLPGMVLVTEPVLLTVITCLLINVVYELLMKRWAVTRVLMWLVVAGFVHKRFQLLQDTIALTLWTHPTECPYMDLCPFGGAHETWRHNRTTGGGTWLFESTTGQFNMDACQ